MPEPRPTTCSRTPFCDSTRRLGRSLLITTRARDHTLLILGASEEGLLSRLTGHLGPLGVVEDVDISVLLAEKAYDRSFMDRLLGVGEDDMTPPSEY